MHPWLFYAIEIIAILVVGSIAYAAAKGAPWVPTWKRDIDRLTKLIDLKPGETFYELGCGDGRVCTNVSDAFPEARVIGVELGIPQWLVAQARRIRRGTARLLSFKLADLHKLPLHDADVVYMFLMPEPYARLKPKLEAELKPGARVVSYVWPVEGWIPEKIDTEGKSILYFYRR